MPTAGDLQQSKFLTNDVIKEQAIDCSQLNNLVYANKILNTLLHFNLIFDHMMYKLIALPF